MFSIIFISQNRKPFLTDNEDSFEITRILQNIKVSRSELHEIHFFSKFSIATKIFNMLIRINRFTQYKYLFRNRFKSTVSSCKCHNLFNKKMLLNSVPNKFTKVKQ